MTGDARKAPFPPALRPANEGCSHPLSLLMHARMITNAHPQHTREVRACPPKLKAFHDVNCIDPITKRVLACFSVCCLLQLNLAPMLKLPAVDCRSFLQQSGLFTTKALAPTLRLHHQYTRHRTSQNKIRIFTNLPIPSWNKQAKG